MGKNYKPIPLFIWLFLIMVISSCNKDSLKLSEEGRLKFTIPFGKSYNYVGILVTKVIDGDTLQLETGERVRLIGIDTPEMYESDKLYRDARRSKEDISTIQRLGTQAFGFTKDLVEGERISLEFDVEKYDKYDRLLGYVYLADGTFVNAEIVKQGYANLLTVPPNLKYKDLFLKLHREARENKRGLWK